MAKEGGLGGVLPQILKQRFIGVSMKRRNVSEWRLCQLCESVPLLACRCNLQVGRDIEEREREMSSGTHYIFNLRNICDHRAKTMDLIHWRWDSFYILIDFIWG